MRNSNRWHVFVSHAHEDAKSATLIAGHLEARGLTCWLDREQLRAADPFDDRILEAIGQSSVVLVLVSRAAMGKDYVRHEVSSALGRSSKVVPYFLERLAPDELRTPFDFKTLRVHSLQHDPARPDEGLEKLARDLRLLTRWSRWPARLMVGLILLALLAGAWTAYHFSKPRLLPLAELIERGNPPWPEKPVSSTLDMQFDIYGLRAGVGGWRPMTNALASLASGESYFIHARPLTLPGHLYVFTCDSRGQIQWLFPRNQTFKDSNGANPVEANQLVTLPDGQRGYRLDDAIGEEQFYVVFSRTRWLQLEEALVRATRSGPSPLRPLPKSKGTADAVEINIAQPAPREFAGQTVAAAPTALVFRSEKHWMVNTRVIRHVAPGEAR